MTIPPIVSVAEIAAMLGLTKSRVGQLVEQREFPDHYVRLHVGRLWQTNDILKWAYSVGRNVKIDIPETPSRRARSGTSTVEPTKVYRSAEPLLVQRPLVGGQTPPTITAPTTPVVTISSGEEPSVETGEKPQSPSLASLATSTVLADSPEVSEPPSRRSTIELNKLALAEDWDTLERIYEDAKKAMSLPESEMKLLGFAAMVIASEANVPNYRRTKDQMIKAWGEVRRAYEPTSVELVALAQHLVASAQTPFTPGAVKKFSDFEIAKIRRTATAQKARPQGWSRWQGAHGSKDAEINNLTPEERAQYGVAERK